ADRQREVAVDADEDRLRLAGHVAARDTVRPRVTGIRRASKTEKDCAHGGNDFLHSTPLSGRGRDMRPCYRSVPANLRKSVVVDQQFKRVAKRELVGLPAPVCCPLAGGETASLSLCGAALSAAGRHVRARNLRGSVADDGQLAD